MPEAGQMDSPAYRLYRWYWGCFDWLYPPTCGGCGKPGSRWCQNCHQQAKHLPLSLCPRCGHPSFPKNTCAQCRTSPPAYEALRSWAVYAGPVRSALHSLKYRKNVGLGEALSQPLIQMYKRLDWCTDLIIPVPISAARFRERGYNQVSYLARPLAMAARQRYCESALIRIADHPSQVGLSKEERIMNIAGSFLAVGDKVSGKRILIVDDVITTGATMQACTEALITAGAQVVYGITLARSIRSPLENR